MLRIRLALILIIMVSLVLGGCWNYREIEQMSIVAGMAVDVDPTGDEYELTIEVLSIVGGQEIKPKSKVMTITGETIFDAVRNAIALTSRKLYWSHAKIIIFCENAARKGLVKVVDWYVRDAETRPDVNLIVAKGTAKDILHTAQQTDEILSFQLSEMIDSEKELSTSRSVEAWEFINDIASEGIHPMLPVIELVNSEGNPTARMEGSAVLKGDRLVGYLTGEETKYALFVKDKIEGGLLVETLEDKDENTRVALEIFKNKTSLTPRFIGNTIVMDISVKTTVGIDEIMGTMDVISEEGSRKLAAQAESDMKKNIEDVIKKVQKEFGSDIFGFGNTIYKNNPREWKRFRDDWDLHFPNVQVNVTCDIIIEGSALLKQPLYKAE